MPFIRTGDLTVHYDLTGPADAPVVLFANSIGTSFHVWDAQVPAVSGRYRMLRYDKRGHGLTDATPVPEGAAGYTMDRLADDALALLDALGIGRAHVCGLSIGGMIAQRMAGKAADRVASLVLCDTAARIGPPALWDDRIRAIRAGGLGSIAAGVMGRWFTDAFRAREADRVRGYVNMLSRTTMDGYIGCAMAIRDADLAADNARTTCPTLVMVGDQDLATLPAAAEALAAAIPGARLTVLTDAAHIPCVEQPDALNAALLAFLDSLPQETMRR